MWNYFSLTHLFLWLFVSCLIIACLSHPLSFFKPWSPTPAAVQSPIGLLIQVYKLQYSGIDIDMISCFIVRFVCFHFSYQVLVIFSGAWMYEKVKRLMFTWQWQWRELRLYCNCVFKTTSESCMSFEINSDTHPLIQYVPEKNRGKNKTKQNSLQPCC